MTASRSRTKAAQPEFNEAPTSEPENTETTPEKNDDTATEDTGTDWDAFLAAATTVDRKTERPPVDVPQNVIDFVTTRLKDGQAAFLPVTDADDYDVKKLVFQSAADLTDPKSSATCVPAGSDRKNVAKADNWRDLVKFIRVTVGPRRGTSKRAANVEQPATEANNE